MGQWEGQRRSYPERSLSTSLDAYIRLNKAETSENNPENPEDTALNEKFYYVQNNV